VFRNPGTNGSGPTTRNRVPFYGAPRSDAGLMTPSSDERTLNERAIFKCGASVTNRPRRYFPLRDLLLLRVPPSLISGRLSADPRGTAGAEFRFPTKRKLWQSRSEGRLTGTEEKEREETRNRGTEHSEIAARASRLRKRALTSANHNLRPRVRGRARARVLVKVGKKSGSGVPRVLDFRVEDA